MSVPDQTDANSNPNSNPKNLQNPVSPLPQQPQVLPQPLPQTSTTPGKRLPGWRLWLPLLAQTVLILSIPAQDAYTYIAGRQITLQTAPVDPYDLLRGHYQTLGYEISQAERLQKLPGGELLDQAQSTGSQKFYLVLQAANGDQASHQANSASNSAQPPKPWQPLSLSAQPPTNLAANQVAIRGQVNRYGRITYGIETYYMPEQQRNALNADISSTQSNTANAPGNRPQQPFVVDVKVDQSGNAVPISLWVQERNYRF